MKFTLPSLFAFALLASLVYEPKPALAQSKEEKATRAVQLDVYEALRKLDELKAAVDGRVNQMEAQLKQLMESNAKLAADQAGLLETVKAIQTEAQRRAYDPLAAIKVNVEDTSGDVAAMQAVLETMRKQQDEMSKTLYDLGAAVKLIPTTPPPAPDPIAPSLSSADAAKLLFASAQLERAKGNLNAAIKTFVDLAQQYPDAPEAPVALYEAGSIYAGYDMYDDAMQAFDRVLEQFGDNPMRKDAQFRKAEMLANLNKKTEAIREYENFAKQYPDDDKTALAVQAAKDLRAPAPAKPKPAAKQSKAKNTKR